jgi:hypothetical protein
LIGFSRTGVIPQSFVKDKQAWDLHIYAKETLQ